MWVLIYNVRWGVCSEDATMAIVGIMKGLSTLWIML
jgi:hypothetical protein